MISAILTSVGLMFVGTAAIGGLLVYGVNDPISSNTIVSDIVSSIPNIYKFFIGALDLFNSFLEILPSPFDNLFKAFVGIYTTIFIFKLFYK